MSVLWYRQPTRAGAKSRCPARTLRRATPIRTGYGRGTETWPPPWLTSYVAFLYLQQLVDALFGQGDEGIHAGAAEDITLACSLYFNKLMLGRHYDVEIDIGS